jgi:hypothetical protein
MSMRSNLTMALVAMAVAGLEGNPRDTYTLTKPGSEEEKKARAERERLEEEAEAKRRHLRSEQYQREQDAIAAPYREARRLRNLRKLEQQAQRKP